MIITRAGLTEARRKVTRPLQSNQDWHDRFLALGMDDLQRDILQHMSDGKVYKRRDVAAACNTSRLGIVAFWVAVEEMRRGGIVECHRMGRKMRLADCMFPFGRPKEVDEEE